MLVHALISTALISAPLVSNPGNSSNARSDENTSRSVPAGHSGRDTRAEQSVDPDAPESANDPGDSIVFPAEEEDGAEGSDEWFERGSAAESSRSATAAAAAPIRIMTANMRVDKDRAPNRWVDRKSRFAEMIRVWSPDLIAVQEAVASTRDDLNTLIDTQVPGGYTWWAVRRNGTVGTDEMLVLYYKASRLELAGKHYRHVSRRIRDDKCPIGYGDRDFADRPIQGARFVDKTTNRQFYAYNNHFPSGNGCERIGMADILADFMDDRTNPWFPAVALGDFNAGIEPDGSLNESFVRVLNETGFWNPWAVSNCWSNTCSFATMANGFNKVDRQGRMIDHILVEGPIQSTGAWIDRHLMSSTNVAYNCPFVFNGVCTAAPFPQVSSLYHYSDHWSLITDIVP